MQLMRLLTLGAEGVDLAIFDARRLYHVILDLHRFFIAFSRVVVDIMMEGKVQPLTMTSYGLLVLFPEGVGWSMLYETTPCCLDPRISGYLVGFVYLLRLLLLKM